MGEKTLVYVVAAGAVAFVIYEMQQQKLQQQQFLQQLSASQNQSIPSIFTSLYNQIFDTGYYTQEYRNTM